MKAKTAFRRLVCFIVFQVYLFALISCGEPGTKAITPVPPSPIDPATRALRDYDSVTKLRSPSILFSPSQCTTDLSESCSLVSSDVYNSNADQSIEPDFVSQEFMRLLKTLNPEQASRLAGWSIVVGSCAQGLIIRWATSDSSATPRTICFSALLAREIFLQSARTTMSAIDDRLDIWHIDKTQFNFTYRPEYLVAASGQMTQEDLVAWIGAERGLAQAVWGHFQGSIDYVLAHEMAHVFLNLPSGDSSSELACSRAAATILSGVVDVSSLTAVLDSAINTPDLPCALNPPNNGTGAPNPFSESTTTRCPTDIRDIVSGKRNLNLWGFEVVGDASQTLAYLSTIQIP